MIHLTSNTVVGETAPPSVKSPKPTKVEPHSICSDRWAPRTLQIPKPLYDEVTQQFELTGHRTKDEAGRKRRQFAFYQIDRLIHRESAPISSEIVQRVLGRRGREKFMSWLNGSLFIKNLGGYFPGRQCNSFAINWDAIRGGNNRKALQHNIDAPLSPDWWGDVLRWVADPK